MSYARHASLGALLCMLFGCTTTSSSPSGAAPVPDSGSPPVAEPERSGGERDAGEPHAPGPSFTVPAEELVVQHAAAPGGQSRSYDADVDETTLEGGEPTMRLASKEGATFTSFAATTAVHEVDETFAGRRYRMRAKIKTEDATSGWLWLRMDAETSMRIDNMMHPVNRSIAGTTDWKEVALVMDVPVGTWRFAFGSGLRGEGKVWVGAITFEEVGAEVATTPSVEVPFR